MFVSILRKYRTCLSVDPQLPHRRTTARARSYVSRIAAVSCLALLTACGGGGDMSSTPVSSATGSPATGSSVPTPTGSSCSASSCGAAILTMTDAKGDFLSYIVTLTSLQLQTANGTSVETLPTATKVDFAQLVDLTEIMSAGQIPAANYVSATLTIDYTNASITADDGTGNGVALQPVDANGNPLTGTLQVAVQLDNANHLVITPAAVARLDFDFNLAASNTVNMTNDTVQVSPTLVATVVPSNTKQIRVRGSLASATAAQSDFVLNVQPFHDTSATSGTVTVQVAPTTTYQINGAAYVGTAGLTALAALPAGTMVAAFGSLQSGTQVLSATEVLAGTSLENPAEDQISGTVIARTSTTLTVRGATWWERDGDFEFDPHDATVTIGTNTGVTEEGQMGAFTVADISVGQHIDAFGTASQPSGGTLTLDATAGEVRLDITPAWGVVSNLAANSLTLNLESLDGLPVSAFNFSGTGSSTTNDANASAYVVNTGTLPQTGLATGSPARVFGFVTPFGSAPPDFTATSLVNYSAVTAYLVVNWAGTGSATAFSGLTASSTSLTLSLTNVGPEHVIDIGPQQLDITTLAAPPTIAPGSASTGLFAIGHAGKIMTDNYNSFAAFVTALSGDLSGTTTVIDIAASGQYDSATNTFTATRIAVLLNN
jgi:hypothetical protein